MSISHYEQQVLFRYKSFIYQEIYFHNLPWFWFRIALIVPRPLLIRSLLLYTHSSHQRVCSWLPGHGVRAASGGNFWDLKIQFIIWDFPSHNCAKKQESSPAWPQEAYRPRRSLFWVGWGYPVLSRGGGGTTWSTDRTRGYPPPWTGSGDTSPVDRQTNKTLPFRRTTYACGNKSAVFLVIQRQNYTLSLPLAMKYIPSLEPLPNQRSPNHVTSVSWLVERSRKATWIQDPLSISILKNRQVFVLFIMSRGGKN